MMSNPLAVPTREQVERGVAVVTAQDNRWLRCDLKTTSLLGNVLMRQLAVDHDAVETVMFRDGLPDRGVGVERADRPRRHGHRAAEGQPDPARASRTTRRSRSRASAGVAARRARRCTHAEAMARRRDVAVVVDEGSARHHDGRRPSVRRRRAGTGVPTRLAGVPEGEGRRRRHGLTGRPVHRIISSHRRRGLAARSFRNRPCWNTRPRPRARSTVTISPMNSMWSPARCRA